MTCEPRAWFACFSSHHTIVAVTDRVTVRTPRPSGDGLAASYLPHRRMITVPSLAARRSIRGDLSRDSIHIVYRLTACCTSRLIILLHLRSSPRTLGVVFPNFKSSPVHMHTKVSAGMPKSKIPPLLEITCHCSEDPRPPTTKKRVPDHSLPRQGFDVHRHLP